MVIESERTLSWLSICKGSYLFSEERASWDEAGEYCELFGGHLLQIDNIYENNCLLTEASSRSLLDDYWHSANDIEVYSQAAGALSFDSLVRWRESSETGMEV